MKNNTYFDIYVHSYPEATKEFHLQINENYEDDRFHVKTFLDNEHYETKGFVNLQNVFDYVKYLQYNTE